ncbi:MAG: hypothetical protein ACRELB_19355 [Polyangiaceae bacterium]
MSKALRALAALGATAWLLAGCPPGGGGAGDGGADGAPDAPGDAPGDASVADGANGDGGPGADGATDATAGDAGIDAESGDAPADAGEGSTTGPEGGPACTFDAGSAPEGGPVCGDGWRDPSTEECDDGLGTSTVRRGCSSQCQVLDELAVAPSGDGGLTADGSFTTVTRSLGTGRHTVAASDSSLGVVYVETTATPVGLSLATFSAKGVGDASPYPLGAGSTVVDDSNPVVAGLPCGKYAVAWGDYDATGGDELDIAIRLVDPSVPAAAPPAHANTSTAFSQFDPDIVWTGSEIVVAWVDDSDAATEPDIRFRTFDASMNPTSAEQTLAATGDSEADVALTAFAGTWAAAWRDDVNGVETVRVQAGGNRWTVGPAFLPAPVAAKPAITALDGTHLLVVYAVGTDDADSGVASGSRVWAAVVDMAAPGVVAGVQVLGTSGNGAGVDQSVPAAVSVPGTAFVSWSTAGAMGDANGEELWLKAAGWNGTSLDLSAAEVPLPRWAQARVGDQEAPSLVMNASPPGGAIVAGWEDLGGAMGAGEGSGDVVMELIPVPVLRGAGEGGP